MLVLLTKCDVLVVKSDFLMLLFVVAHKKKNEMVLCFDLILQCNCLFFLN